MKTTKYTFLKKLMLLGLPVSFFFMQETAAQISITDNQTALQLATNLTGGGVAISNATLNCPGVSNGIFNVTSSNLGLDQGIILTSGRAKTIATDIGANGAGTSSTPSLATGNGSDPDLLIFTSPQSSNDKCILEFDFVPTGDSVKFKYVFGSTEYQIFTCQFADVFGFFLSGPGIAGPFSNNAKNLALVPGTNCPVGVNTINASTATTCGAFTAPCVNNGMYFVNNIGGTTVAYNGFTVPLQAISAVTPGQTHHLKLAICDAGDQVLDSGVWLKQGSLTSATTTVTQCGPYTWPVNGVTYTATGVYTFVLPSGNTEVLDLTIFCPTNVPTMSEWGLIILCLISLSIGMVFLFKQEHVLAFAGQSSRSGSNTIFNKSLYAKVFAAVLGIAVTGLFLSYLYFGSLTLTDTIGTVISASIVAFMVQFYLLVRKNEQ